MNTVKSIELEKVLVIDMTSLLTAFSHLPADQMYPVLNRDYLTIPIQIQLSKKN